MLIIDQNTEQILYRDIQHYHKNGRMRRCLCLKLSDLVAVPEKVISELVEAAKEFFNDENGQIYICKNYDVLVSTGKVRRKQIVRFLARISPKLTPGPLPRDLAVLFETEVNWNELVVFCKKKLQDLRYDENILRQQVIEEQQEQKRRNILNIEINKNHVLSISQRRTQRENISVLIVEDDIFTQKLVKNTIAKTAAVDAAKNGYEAITIYADKAPDVLFLDIGLPDVSGHDILQKILKIDPEAYIVMLSGNGDKENVVKAIEIGAKGFVGKPFTKNKLFQYIEKSPHVLAKSYARKGMS